MAASSSVGGGRYALLLAEQLRERACSQSGARDRRDAERRLVLARQRQRVERLVEVIAVPRVEVTVLDVGPKRAARKARPFDEGLDQVGRRWEALHERHEAEER